MAFRTNNVFWLAEILKIFFLETAEQITLCYCRNANVGPVLIWVFGVILVISLCTCGTQNTHPMFHLNATILLDVLFCKLVLVMNIALSFNNNQLINNVSELGQLMVKKGEYDLRITLSLPLEIELWRGEGWDHFYYLLDFQTSDVVVLFVFIV